MVCRNYANCVGDEPNRSSGGHPSRLLTFTDHPIGQIQPSFLLSASHLDLQSSVLNIKLFQSSGCISRSPLGVIVTNDWSLVG
jgi:hypothetical protein